MKTNYIKYSILIWLWTVLWVVISNIWNVFGAQNPGQGIEATEIITNEACIEYTTPSWTGIKCDDVVVNLKTGNTQYEYFIKKRQKTWGMTNFTTWDVIVQSGGYIQYRVNFGSITWACNNWTIKDLLPSCVKYISSEIYGVSGSPSFSTGNWYIQYRGFSLNSGTSWYILVTGQIISDGTKCKDVKQDVNTWAFKCGDPASNWIYSSVVAIRTWWGWGWGWSWSQVVFTKTWNKYEIHPGETWLVFTLYVKNNWPEKVTDVVIEDIWPDNGDCILFSWWTSQTQNLDFIGNYKWKYNKHSWQLLSWEQIKLTISANIANNPSCTWSYINTWKLTYEWWEKYDKHPFIVDDGSLSPEDITITKTTPLHSVQHWQNITYTITYRNNSRTKTLYDYKIIDTWPSELTFIDSNPVQDSISWNIITWENNLRPLWPQEERVIKINAKVK